MLDRKILRADGLLLLTALIWGLAFVAQRVGSNYLPPSFFNGIRFLLGSLTVFPFIFSKKGNPHFFQKTELVGGILCGILLAIASNFQQYGIVHTTAGKAGFITGLYVVIVPFFGVFTRNSPGWGSWVGAFLALGGLFLLSPIEGQAFLRGDLLVLICAIFFAFHVLFLSFFAKRVEPIRLAFVQFFTCAILSLVVSLCFENFGRVDFLGSVIPLIFGGVFSVGIAYTLQVVAQRDTVPTHAAIIMSLEAVFAAISGWAILGEILTSRAIFGCALMFLGSIVAQLKP